MRMHEPSRTLTFLSAVLFFVAFAESNSDTKLAALRISAGIVSLLNALIAKACKDIPSFHTQNVMINSICISTNLFDIYQRYFDAILHNSEPIETPIVLSVLLAATCCELFAIRGSCNAIEQIDRRNNLRNTARFSLNRHNPDRLLVTGTPVDEAVDPSDRRIYLAYPTR